jgi:hypothetical protein
MQHDDKRDIDEKTGQGEPLERRSYASPKVESVRLSKDAAESLT